ncbi:MAG: ABC transporter ATP-binding protein [Xanthomonadales bacterium]|jgi:ABC-type lipoprotein export system ATPase subunit|nr:ABC transporter ATP-binding protein [Xanthomonadales bacterium]
MIELDRIEKSYPLGGQRHYVLRQVRLNIAEGDFLSIMGPSGSGKTSLLSVLGLMDADWSGSYRFDGVALESLKERQRKDFARDHIGFVFQHYHLLDELTVAENLELPLTYRNVRGSERQARVAELLDRFGMAARKDLYPRQLSGGQQQIVAVARAVIARPRLLLCDEPTGALHSTQGVQVMDLLSELNRDGTTIVQVTHNPEYAARGRRRVELRDGWLELPA